MTNFRNMLCTEWLVGGRCRMPPSRWYKYMKDEELVIFGRCKHHVLKPEHNDGTIEEIPQWMVRAIINAEDLADI